MISAFSRYANNKVTPIVTPKGTRSTIIIQPPSAPATYNVALYTWEVGDQIDFLAHSAYGDDQQWWRIANANPEILYWNNIAPGTVVRVPNA